MTEKINITPAPQNRFEELLAMVGLDYTLGRDDPTICEKCGRQLIKHVGPLSTVIQHEDTGRVSCTASGLRSHG